MRASMSRRSALSAASRARERARLGAVGGQQAVDAERHVLEPAGCVEARADLEAEVLRDDGRSSARPAASSSAASPGGAATGADAPQALRDEDAVVEVERHDVGHGAERDEVEQVGGIRRRGAGHAPRSRSARVSAAMT